MADPREETPTSESDDNNVRADNDLRDTDDKYTCSGCDQEDNFQYTVDEDEACCKHCGHQKCEECKKSD
ncbi:hypothetical protein F4801DRAFT_548978 [Xylaria longipes]|nr:hypothetical protein F4801DRAFT_548978 [Xylaria longipes]